MMHGFRVFLKKTENFSYLKNVSQVVILKVYHCEFFLEKDRGRWTHFSNQINKQQDFVEE